MNAIRALQEQGYEMYLVGTTAGAVSIDPHGRVQLNDKCSLDQSIIAEALQAGAKDLRSGMADIIASTQRMTQANPKPAATVVEVEDMDDAPTGPR